MAEDAKNTGPVRMVAIENMVESIRYKSQILARTNKIDSGSQRERFNRVYCRIALCVDPDFNTGTSGGMR